MIRSIVVSEMSTTISLINSAKDLLACLMRDVGVVPCASKVFAQQKQAVTIRRRENRPLICSNPSYLFFEGAHSYQSLIPATLELSGD